MRFFTKPIILLAVVISTIVPAKALDSFTRTIAPDGTVVWIYDGKIENSEDYIRYYVRYCDKVDGNMIAKLKYDKKSHKIGVIARSPYNTKFKDIQDMAKHLDNETKMEDFDKNNLFQNTNKKVLTILNIKEEPLKQIVQEPKNIDEWLEDFRGKIKANWKPNKDNDGTLKTIVEFYVKKDGTIESYKVKQSSGNDDFDKYAQHTLVSLQPYMPLPKDYNDKVLISFTFKLNDYNQMDEKTVYKEWWKDFQNQVQANWKPTTTSKTHKEYRTTVSFFIADDGKVEDCKISNSSGNTDFDNYALKTLMAGQPYKPMPKEGTEKVPIKFTFTFNPDKKSSSVVYFDDATISKITKKWHPDKSVANKEISLEVVVNKDGKVEDCKVIQTSGHEKSDQKAIKAVYKASPFKKVEEKYLDYGKEKTTEIIKISK